MNAALLTLAAMFAALLAHYWRRQRHWRALLLRCEGVEGRLDDALALLQALPAAVVGTDHLGAVRYLNRRAELMTGCAAADGAGRPIGELLAVYQDGLPVDARQQVLDCVLRREVLEAARGVVLLRRADGRRIDVQYSCAPVALAAQPQPGAVLLLQDVSARRSAEARLEFIAHHDGLTGLPNRLHFQIRFEHGIAYAKRHRSLLAVLFVDLDRFKGINDSLGHDVGDQVLIQFAQRVLQCVRKVDTVARQGGDEFIILLTEMHTAQDAERVAEKIACAVQPPFVIGEYSLAVKASVGIAIYPDDDDDVGQLIEKADIAMYAAKRHAPGSCVRYLPSMQAQSYANGALEADLGHALERGEFVLQYQPRLDLREQRVTGVKALLRWRHPRLGMVMPRDFLPLLEERGMILPVGAWVLAEAAEQARRWREQGQPLTVSVSLSARQFYQTDIAPSFAAILAAAGLPGRCVELEIAAGVLVDKNQDCAAILRQFKQLGMRIAISDFGTGDTSLNYLKRFPADVVKIEKCFIDELGRQDGAVGDRGAMVRALVAMAHTMKMRVVAGGVETADQLAQLVAMDCDEAFGYYLSRAVAPDEIDALLKSSSSWIGLSWQV
ncbi:putative bifunctional diguanylate cyclase/phosphodiesterase [Janthinobacterium sp.]|uniref:putative bifunctional diguanylate cyclase/phosphodiesterase n=1 Tax=Janthinobacterium sp. TaxID=1871054 RepID=UPI00293D7105|nr:EAL domain-containing protein [Janthinobacterium sp.]